MINSGVYVITNIISSKAYIGSTKDFEGRWKGHRAELLRNVHGNPHLQYAWNKYGTNVFEFSILEHVNDLDKLVEVEQFWMDAYRKEGRKLYNCGMAADCPARGRKFPPMSKETRQRMGEAHKKENLSPESLLRRSRSLMGHEVTQETRDKIRRTNTGKKHSKEAKVKIREFLRNLPPEVRLEINRKIGKANARPYPSFIHYKTEEIIPAGVNLTALSRELGLNSDCMRNVIKGRQKSHRGWRLYNV